jgi:gamma-glutamyl-gamma-aminobutyrate hydrolase PuuD
MGKARPAPSRKIKRANDPVAKAISEKLAEDVVLEGLPAKASDGNLGKTEHPFKTSMELILSQQPVLSELGKPGVPDLAFDPTAELNLEPVKMRPRNMLTVVENGDGTTSTLVDTQGKPLVPELPKHKVTVMKDHNLIYPDMYLEVFVTDPPNDAIGFAHMFGRAACTKAKSVLEADLVVFTGGPDVHPSFYGEEPCKQTHWNDHRDTADIGLYLMCLEEGIPMLGICRGAQFLHVMNGGKLYQHVDGHYGEHPIYDHRNKKRIEKVSSVHHQMVMPNTDGGMEIIATCAESKERWKNPSLVSKGSHPDIEAFFYRDTCSIGIQGHPEYAGYNYYTKWCLELVNDLVCCNPDIDWVNKNRRMNPDLLAQRKSMSALSITNSPRKDAN